METSGVGNDSLWTAVSVVAVSRQRKILALLGLEEGVGQGDGIHSRHAGILVELGVDVEEDGHVHLFMGV